MKIEKWQEIAGGIWSASIGSGYSLNPIAVADKKPKLDAINKMDAADFPNQLKQIEIEDVQNKLIISHTLKDDEKIYGLGLHFFKMNHRGRTRYLRVNSDPKIDTGETHAPVPFYVSDNGYGVLINTARIVTIYCGSCVRKDDDYNDDIRDRNSDADWSATVPSDKMEIVIPSEKVEIIIFAGKSMLDVVRRYNLYCGGGVIPPRWGLGFWHRVPTVFKDEEVIEEAMEFRKREFPCDVIGLEPGWHSKSYPVTYEWSVERYPKPAEFVSRMADDGFHINLWEHPYVSPDAKIYPKLKPLSGSHTVWGGLAPDVTLQAAKDIIKTQHSENHVDIGVSGYKIDECDGSELTGSSWMFPAHSQFPSGFDGEQMRQIYGLSYQKLTDEIFREKNIRTYGLVRASNAGASSMPYVLYSDLYDHRQFVRALCNIGFSGLLWTPEIRRANNAADWVRRMQVVCLSPLAMLNAWSDGTKPWSYPEVEHIVRKYINLRMKLMPYLYSAFARYHFDGTPPFRAVEMEIDKSSVMDSDEDNYINSDAAYGRSQNNDLDDQYMMGDSMLIAPLFDYQTKRDVFLPNGYWYDFETGEKYKGGGMITVEAELDKIPIFVRDGAVIPTMPVMQHAPSIGDAVPIEVLYYGNASGGFMLYDDDGESFDFEKGMYRWITLNAEVSENNDGVYSILRDDDWQSSYSTITWKHIK